VLPASIAFTKKMCSPSERRPPFSNLKSLRDEAQGVPRECGQFTTYSLYLLFCVAPFTTLRLRESGHRLSLIFYSMEAPMPFNTPHGSSC
jgi:hypothetical protein